mgnify:CR=1 FL=1
MNSLLEEIVNKQGEPEAKAVIRALAQATGLSENDPLFLLLIGLSPIGITLEKSPNIIKQTFLQCHNQLKRELQDYEKMATQSIEYEVSKSVRTLLDKTKVAKAQVTTRSFLSAGFIALGLVVAGLLGGFGISQKQVAKQRLDPSGAVQLTLEEANAMAWAMSPAGQYAKTLLSWNEDLLAGQCQQQVNELEVTIRVGTRKAESGFCLVWTEPPEKRKYVE